MTLHMHVQVNEQYNFKHCVSDLYHGNIIYDNLLAPFEHNCLANYDLKIIDDEQSSHVWMI